MILGREFSVVKQPLALGGVKALADARDGVDLLIFGVTPQLGSQLAALLHLAAKLPFAVLFLVDSKSVAQNLEREAEIGCLAKPFNPYELYRKVGQLLARRGDFPRMRDAERDHAGSTRKDYLGFPFIGRSAASLAERFERARLPLLLAGEIGCGQERVAAAMCAGGQFPALRFTIDASDITEQSLLQARVQISAQDGLLSLPMNLLIHNLDRCSREAQMRLLQFLEEGEGGRENLWPVTTTSSDLLERVYRGEFLEPLYYRLATLTLRLAPLRERREEIPALAEWLARHYARRLNLHRPQLSEDAIQRLQNYLWFGNTAELEMVIARTLACHRKPLIAGEDLIFDFGPDPALSNLSDFHSPAIIEVGEQGQAAEPRFEVYGGAGVVSSNANGHPKAVDLNAVIHELAHELKNPMVTIKTFAQLLGERYQDENFRSHFQEVVGGDIDRMDDLLEMMIEFADFSKPFFSRVSLAEKVSAVVAELQGECAKRQARVHWKGNGAPSEIRTDESQLQYILKNILIAILAEMRRGSEIAVDLSRQGALSLSYLREAPPMASLSKYLEQEGQASGETIFPLRVLLAKHLLERNGGRFTLQHGDNEKQTLILEFSIAEHRNEN